MTNRVEPLSTRPRMFNATKLQLQHVDAGVPMMFIMSNALPRFDPKKGPREVNQAAPSFIAAPSPDQAATLTPKNSTKVFIMHTLPPGMCFFWGWGASLLVELLWE